MTNLKSRVSKLEAASQPAAGNRTVVIYAHEHTAEEIEAMRQDTSIGTLMIVRYEERKPVTDVEWRGQPVKRYIGLDFHDL